MNSIIEGLHALLDLAPWNSVAGRYDERIMVDTATSLARSRIIARHLRDGVERTAAAATRRADESDMLNAATLLNNLVPPSITVDFEAGTVKFAAADDAGCEAHTEWRTTEGVPITA